MVWSAVILWAGRLRLGICRRWQTGGQDADKLVPAPSSFRRRPESSGFNNPFPRSGNDNKARQPKAPASKTCHPLTTLASSPRRLFLTPLYHLHPCRRGFRLSPACSRQAGMTGVADSGLCRAVAGSPGRVGLYRFSAPLAAGAGSGVPVFRTRRHLARVCQADMDDGKRREIGQGRCEVVGIIETKAAPVFGPVRFGMVAGQQIKAAV